MKLTGQLFRFALVGGIATLVHYLVALALVGAIGVYPANLGGYAAAVGVSYFGHLRFTFRVDPAGASHGRRVLRFVVVSLSGLLFSQAVLALGHAGVGLSPPLALAVAVVAVPVFTFIAQRTWVFAADR